MDNQLIPKENFKKQILEAAIHEVISLQPFLGNMLQVLQIRVHDGIPTAAITYDPRIKSFLMYVNPNFFMSLSFDERVAVLLHEASHITNKHLISIFLGTIDRKDKSQQTEMMKWNLSMDVAINQYIKNLPKQAMRLDMFKKVGGGELEAQKHFEYYYENIDWEQAKKDFGENDCPVHGDGSNQQGSGEGENNEESQEAKGEGNGEDESEGEGNGSGQSSPGHNHGQNGSKCSCKNHKMATLDDHSMMNEDAQGVSQEELLKAAKDLFQRTIQKTVFSHSTIPGNVKDFLDEIDKKLSKINYKQLLQKVIRKSLPAMDRQNTWFRPSKRYAYQAPGSKDGLVPRVEIFIDTSGSISKTEMTEFLNEVDQILKNTKNETTLHLFHTNCYYTTKFRRGQTAEDLKIESGGTDLQDCFEKMKKRRADLVVFLTDGYFGDVQTDKNLTYKTLFVISRNGTVKHPLERLGQTVQVI